MDSPQRLPDPTYRAMEPDPYLYDLPERHRSRGPGPDATECPICHIDIEPDEATLRHRSEDNTHTRAGCGVTFHEFCLDRWVDALDEADLKFWSPNPVIICPMCR